LTDLIALRATVIEDFLDSSNWVFFVAGLSKLGILSVEKETGAITSNNKITIWQSILFITNP